MPRSTVSSRVTYFDLILVSSQLSGTLSGSVSPVVRHGSIYAGLQVPCSWSSVPCATLSKHAVLVWTATFTVVAALSHIVAS